MTMKSLYGVVLEEDKGEQGAKPKPKGRPRGTVRIRGAVMVSFFDLCLRLQRPISAGLVAEELGLEPRRVSVQLASLAKEGVIVKWERGLYLPPGMEVKLVDGEPFGEDDAFDPWASDRLGHLRRFATKAVGAGDVHWVLRCVKRGYLLMHNICEQLNYDETAPAFEQYCDSIGYRPSPSLCSEFLHIILILALERKLLGFRRFHEDGYTGDWTRGFRITSKGKEWLKLAG